MDTHPTIIASFTTFGPFLRYLRRRARLTQRDLSIAVGYSTAQICLLEKDQRLPDLTTVAALFVPALDMQEESGLVARLLQLAAAAREPADDPGGIGGIHHPILAAGLGETIEAPLPHLRPRLAAAHLPAPAVPIIGRALAIDQARTMLLDPAVRLLTLVGPPGVGKTRLAIQVGWAAAESFADGVRLIELAATRDPALVATTIAQALDVTDGDQHDLEAAVRSYLSDKQMLLVLDNFEHVLAAAGLVAELLAAAPNVKILVTSRAALRIYGEHEFAVAPLELPTLAALPPPAELARIPSVALFYTRAQAIKHDFTLTEANALAVAAICVHLDGLPLAIELAAAQSRLFTPQELAARLVRGDPNDRSSRTRLHLLTRGPRNSTTRHQTLRGAIDWSYNLLDTDERALFARLGVFVGGWTVEAAEAIASELRMENAELRKDTEPGQFSILHSPFSILEGLAALVDKSLVVRQEQAGVARFTMLETLREYALEQLMARGEQDAMRRRHAHYYLELAEQAAPQRYSRQSAPARRQLDPELENLRAALRWSLSEASDRTIGLRLVITLGPFWYLRGFIREGCAWLEAALSSQEIAGEWRARALMQLGVLLGALGDYQPALARLEESLAMLRTLDDRPLMAQTLARISAIVLLQGDYARASALAFESMALFRDLGEHEQIIEALFQMGVAAVEQGHAEQARPFLEQCIQIAREVGELGYLAAALNVLGMAELEQGDVPVSLARFQEGLTLFQQRDEKLNMAWGLRNLGLAELFAGAIDQGDVHFKESLALYREFGGPDGLAIPLEGLSGVAAARGHPRQSARLLGAAAGIRATVGMPLSPNAQAIYTRMLEPATAQLDPAAWEAEQAHGRDMSLEQALLYALGDAVERGEPLV